MKVILIAATALVLAGCGKTTLSGALATDCTERPLITPTAREIAALTLTTKQQILKTNETLESECGLKPPGSG